MPRLVLMLLLAAPGCGDPSAADPSPRSTQSQRRATSLPTTPPAPPPPTESCHATAHPIELPLFGVRAIGDVGDVSYALGRRPGPGGATTSVLLWLGADGALAFLPLPEEPSLAAIEPGGLCLLTSDHGAPALRRIALSEGEPGAVGPPATLRGLPAGVAEAFSSDGNHAGLVLRTDEGPRRDRVRFEVDLERGRPVAIGAVGEGTEVVCDGSACTFVGVEGRRRIVAVRRAHEGSEARLEIPIEGGCPHVYRVDTPAGTLFVTPARTWAGVWIAREEPFLRPLPLVDHPAPTPACVAVHPFPSPIRPSVLDGHTGMRRLVRWDGDTLAFGHGEALPGTSWLALSRGNFCDGVVEVGWSSDTHPVRTEGGFVDEWQFDSGEVSLLRFDGSGWTATDRTPLVLHHARGSSHHGYSALVLRNGLHVAVLLSPEAGPDPAWLQPYRAPCGGSGS